MRCIVVLSRRERLVRFVVLVTLSISVLLGCGGDHESAGTVEHNGSVGPTIAAVTTFEESTARGPRDDRVWVGCSRFGRVPERAERVGALDLDDDGEVETVLWVTRATTVSHLLATVSGQVVSDVAVEPDVFSPTVLSVVDLDGIGAREVFLGGVGNTARSAMVLTVHDCELGPVRSATADPFLLLVGAGGNSCAPTGCAVGNRCESTDAGLVLQHVESQPVGGGADATVANPPVMLTTTNFRLVGGYITVVANDTRSFASIDDLPSHYPAMTDSDTVQC